MCAKNPSKIPRAQDLHVRFHRVCLDAVAGPRVLAKIDSLQPQTERYERAYTSVFINELEDSVSEHEELIEAIERRDVADAERAAEQNWLNGGTKAGIVP